MGREQPRPISLPNVVYSLGAYWTTESQPQFRAIIRITLAQSQDLPVHVFMDNLPAHGEPGQGQEAPGIRGERSTAYATGVPGSLKDHR